MSSAACIWRKISGLAARYNDVLYTRPTLSHSNEFLIYFGGDIQDLQENMVKHVEKRKYLEWSLDNTALMLSHNFPRYHIFIIRPSRISNVFSCFDNFVTCDEYGIPVFSPTFNALKNLQELVKSFCAKLNTFNENQNSMYTLDTVNLTLMAFSKGCVVLNQFLHEFYYYHSLKKPDDNIINFISHIKSMWWLDGGHGGYKDTWITDQNILESFAKLNIEVNVHLTPYQIRDTCRPWIATEESTFYDTLKSLNVPIKRTVHFENKTRNIIIHFNLLKNIRDITSM